jgi:TrmH family RNA methyltransferase
MLSQSKQKLIRSLQQKKYRVSERLFVAEGIKVVRDLLASPYKTHSIYGTAAGFASLADIDLTMECIELSQMELSSISNQNTPEGLLALVYLDEGIYQPEEWTLILDAINDPGNFGTLIRTARWFGVRNIFCTTGTVDAFNPKCVQAAKGSLFFTNIYYRSVEEIINLISKEQRMLYVADMDGFGAFEAEKDMPKALVLGSESHGPNDAFRKLAGAIVSIPSHSSAAEMDSLNVAVSGGILLSRLVG